MVNLGIKSRLKQGVDLIAKAVGCTLGPKGSNVLIQGDRGLITTKDGITVADHVTSDDPVVAMAIEAIRTASFRTNKVAGDGTTTSVLLAKSFFDKGMDMVESGRPAIEVKRELDTYVKSTSDRLALLSKVANHDKIKDVATIAANNDEEVGKLVADAFDRVGNSGIVECSSSLNSNSYIEFTEGFRLDRGFYEASMYLNIDVHKIVMENPFIVLYNGKINNAQELVAPILQKAKDERRPALFLTKEIDNNVLKIIGLNLAQGVQAMVVIVPGYGEAQNMTFKDLGVYCKSAVITPASLLKYSYKDLGSAKKVIIRSGQCVIEGGAGEGEFSKDDVQSEVEGVRESTYNEGKAEQRLKRASTKLATVFLGAKSELEMKEKMFRAEDAICAVKCALDGGILPGGGNALKAADFMTDNKFNGCASVIHETLNGKPFFRITDKFDFNKGVNRLTDKYEDDLIKAGVVDTTKGVVTALESAGSVAGMLLLTEVCITEDKNK